MTGENLTLPKACFLALNETHILFNGTWQLRPTALEKLASSALTFVMFKGLCVIAALLRFGSY